MKNYLITVPVSARGYQTFTVEARNETEALEKYSRDKADFQDESLEVTDTGEPSIIENV